MERRIVLLGDPTTHGGVVITASLTASVNGKPIARLGDQVNCPHHGVNKIIEGEPSYDIDGIPVALEGHRTACGSTLIAMSTSSVG